jgi:tRNA(His) 5'-end guanylyltransferase
MKKDSLGDRMKGYESITQSKLMNRTPVIIRLDGKAFHTFTRGLDKPFDAALNTAMVNTMTTLCDAIQGSMLGYTQSDEISILLQDWASFTTDGWYDYKIQKMVSVAASIATATFNDIYKHPKKDSLALFDARIFNIPFEEVTNYFVWRQNDAVRNSINSLAQAHFSHKSLQNLNTSQVQDKLMLEKGINWNDVPTRFKRGVCTRMLMETDFMDKSVTPFLSEDYEIPIFTQNRAYIESMLTFHADLEKERQDLVTMDDNEPVDA